MVVVWSWQSTRLPINTLTMSRCDTFPYSRYSTLVIPVPAIRSILTLTLILNIIAAVLCTYLLYPCRSPVRLAHHDSAGADSLSDPGFHFTRVLSISSYFFPFFQHFFSARRALPCTRGLLKRAGSSCIYICICIYTHTHIYEWWIRLLDTD